MNAVISETIKATMLGLSMQILGLHSDFACRFLLGSGMQILEILAMQILEILAPRRFVSAGCPVCLFHQCVSPHPIAHKPPKTTSFNLKYKF